MSPAISVPMTQDISAAMEVRSAYGGLRSVFPLLFHSYKHRDKLLVDVEHWHVVGPGTYDSYIGLKHFTEDFRSALDYVAQIVREHFCLQDTRLSLTHLYMPLRREGESDSEFLGRFDHAFPHLREAHSKTAEALLGTVGQAGPDGEALRLLYRISGELKHRRFTEFRRVLIGHPEWAGPDDPVRMVPHIRWKVAGEDILLGHFLRGSIASVERIHYALFDLVYSPGTT